MSFNKVTIVGNLGRDPELRYTPQGKAVCSFTIATNGKRRGENGQMEDETTWFKITLWGQQAEAAKKYLAKGRPVYIEGRLRIDKWTNREGAQQYTLDVHATDMQFVSAGNGADPDAAAEREAIQQTAPAHSGPEASDLKKHVMNQNDSKRANYEKYDDTSIPF